MDFVPHDEATIREMLAAIGVGSVDELFADVPEQIKHPRELGELPPAMSEPDLRRHLERLASMNDVHASSFLGAGCYYHYVPSVVDFVTSLPQFFTSYTPYQAEASQGLLQAIYEYQSAIARLTGMDVVNASMYDGATALAEAAVMATVLTRRDDILVLEGVHPEYSAVVETYCRGRGVRVDFAPVDGFESSLGGDTAAVLFQSPGFLGDVEDVAGIVERVRARDPKCLVVQAMADPTCLGLIRPPGDDDVDVFVAEGQSFGMHPSFGGPGLGIFAAKSKFTRRIPGRLVGKTREVDGDGEGFILTLQAREQHIRRELAMSNICSNQALCMLAALAYLSCLGRSGLREVAGQNLQKAHYLKEKLASLPSYEVLNAKPTYNEFALRCPDVAGLRAFLEERGFLPPLDLSTYYPELGGVALVCVTELNTKAELDAFVEVARQFGAGGGVA
ncbi:MAG: aminomethyl-transferring glycine dehydrogenase subunit GcvPA [Promethearchaeota archaeon]